MFEEFRNAHHHVSILAVAFAFGSFALSNELMATFFNMTDPLGASALIGLAFYHVVRTLTGIEYAFLDGLNMPEFRTRSITVGVLVQAVLIPLLLPEYGLLGVVGAIVFAQFVTLLIAQAIFRRKFGSVPLPGGLLTQGISGLVMYVAVKSLAGVLGISSVLHLIAVVAAGAVVYVGTLIIVDSGFRGVMRSTVRDMTAMIAKRRNA